MIARTATQALYYLLRKLGPTDKLKAVKLVYLADKYHLLHYGRTITGDRYYAMQHGPVGSLTKDVLAPNRLSLDGVDREYARKALRSAGGYKFTTGEDPGELDMLSPTDVEALDFVVGRFGPMGTSWLRNYTHRYPEWAQYGEQFEHQLTSREEIREDELLSTIDDNVFGVDEDQVKQAREILSLSCRK